VVAVIGFAVVLALSIVPVLVGANAGRASSQRGLPPRLATVLLTGFALSVSLVTGMLLCLEAYVGTVELLPAIHPADWSVPYLRHALPIPGVAAAAAGILAAGLLASAAMNLIRVVVQARRASAVARELPAFDGLAVIDDPSIHAYAIPGRSARIVVSTGLLRLLDGPQRRALLAHERAHLHHRHHLYARLTRLAAAANPLVRPVIRAVDLAIERWADAEAAREVGDPAIVAQALGTAALGPTAPPALGLGMGHSDVVERVRILLDPPERTRHGALRLSLLIALCWVSCVAVGGYVYYLVELAEISYWSTH
jgi:Zn-dependent protease with chaperone function